MSEIDSEIFYFEDLKAKPDPFYAYEAGLQRNGPPIIVDNGSYQCRAGFATNVTPQLIYRNAIAKLRGKKQENETLVGNDMTNIEAVRSSVRSQFDRNIVTQYDIQEKLFDYLFSHLGIDTDGAVNHPMVITEAPLNPLYCKNNMTELLFESYCIPSLTYGVDAMFSLYRNKLREQPSTDALVLSLGYQTLHVIPVLAGCIDPIRCRRVNLGGSQIECFLQRLLQLKYPEHASVLTLSRAEEIVRGHCHVATDYLSQLGHWCHVPYYNANVRCIQLPRNKAAVVVQSAEQIREKREMQVRRLREINRRKKEEKLAVLSQKLQKLTLARDLLQEGENVSLANLGYSTKDELISDVNHTKTSIDKLTRSLSSHVGGGDFAGDDSEVKQRGNRDNVNKGRRSKSKGDKEVTESEAMERFRMEDFDGWLTEMRSKRQTILDKRAERRRHRADMSKRKTLASQQRMQKLTQLAAGEKKQKKKTDTFGMNESDWDIYKEINPTADDSDSDSDGDTLNDIEALLTLYDPQHQGWSETGGDGVSESDLASRYMVHIAVEQIRVPELMFQPSMIGQPECGLAETIEFVLKKFSSDEQQRIVQYIHVTGGLAKLPKLTERIKKEILEIRPFESPFSVHLAADPVLDSWHGARMWSVSECGNADLLTRSMYKECGLDYMRDRPTKGAVFMPKSILVPH